MNCNFMQLSISPTPPPIFCFSSLNQNFLNFVLCTFIFISSFFYNFLLPASKF
uniref:Uncharacterized protein n=1 Tax=Octopus bimaculoides TaxID=37653 RepID=A0A0L8H729_OCTBM